MEAAVTPLSDFAAWGSRLQHDFGGGDVEIGYEVVRHDEGLNDSFKLELWLEKIAGRMTVYEHSRDADFQVLTIEDGRDLLNVHTDEAASFRTAWQDFVNLIGLALPAPPGHSVSQKG